MYLGSWEFLSLDRNRGLSICLARTSAYQWDILAKSTPFRNPTFDVATCFDSPGNRPSACKVVFLARRCISLAGRFV